MKTIVSALFAAVLLAAQIFTPVAAASSASALATVDCGSSYIVQHQDSLFKIASYCGTSVSEILSLNSWIVNPNVIYTGQVLRLSDSTTTTTSTGATTTSGYARVSLSTTRAEAGDEVTVSISGFPANDDFDYRIGEQGETYTIAYDGTTSSSGTASKTITIPSDADEGEYWVVEVITTGSATVVDVDSHTIYIAPTSSTSSDGYDASVSLSSTQGTSGDEITVTASGFPANADIDFRVMKQGESYTVAYDGATSSSGTASQVITLPSSANSGQYWVVQVLTTGRATVVKATSHTIHITS